MWRPLVALGSGAVLDVAFPPHDLWWLAPVAVALLTATTSGRSVRTGAGLGLLHGLGFFLPLLVWTNTIAGDPAWVALSLLEAAFLAGLGAGLVLVRRLPAWPVWAGFLWVAEEALRDRLPFGGFPWGRLAFSQGHTPLTPLAALGGAPLVTLAVAAVGTALATRPRATWLPAVALVVLALVTPTPATGPSAWVAVVQGNVPRLGLLRADQASAVLVNHLRATHELAAAVRAGTTHRPDLVIWPENASDVDPFADLPARQAIDAAARDIGVPILVGTVTAGPGNLVSNRAVVWDPVTGAGASYVKRHPVPFGEYIPMRSLLRHVTDKVDLVPHDFAHGDAPGVLTVGPVRLADVICFEVAYDGVVHDAISAGGRLLVVQTNNATFGRSGETWQQLAMSRLRAVENRRSVVVAATSGVSAVISPDGRVQHRTSILTEDVTVQRVVLSDERTLALRLGWWPELAMSLVAALSLVAGIRR